MRVLYLVNDRAAVKPAQTTAAMAVESARRSGASWIAGVDDMRLEPSGAVGFEAIELRGEDGSIEGVLEAALGREPVSVRDDALDVLLFRTNPGRDAGREALHAVSLSLGRLALRRGVRVLNTPDALTRCTDKLFLAYLPETLRPRMLVSRDPRELKRFVEASERPTVLKPLSGTQGQGVFKVRSGGPNLSAVIAVLTQAGFVIAQEFLRRAKEGDRRVIVVDGKILSVEGKPCGVRRVPRAKGEFRSNVHLGGEPMPLDASPAVLRAASAIGEHLREHGVWMAGVDLVGTKAVEINVRSPGGLPDASAFAGVDYVGALLDTLEPS